MSDFVDPSDPRAVEQVLAPALRLLGVTPVLDALAPHVPVQPGRPAGRFRREEPAVVGRDQDRLEVRADGGGRLLHVVGGVVLSTDGVAPVALPGLLAALVARSVQGSGTRDAASVTLTSLRDAVGSAL